MKTQKELKQLLTKKVEEINLSQQVDLAVDYAKYKKDATGINMIVKEVLDFQWQVLRNDDVPEIDNAIKLLKEFQNKVRSAK